MRILVAEDDPVSRRALEADLQAWGYEVLVAGDGEQAWETLRRPPTPELALIDWVMPRLDGVQICRKLRQEASTQLTYLILLTSRDTKHDIVSGLSAGADDYVTKPFDPDELRARIQVGRRVLGLQKSLSDRLQELSAALERVQQLQGLVPICSYCKRVRNDQNYWEQLEAYISERSAAEFTHGICPDCYEKNVNPELGKQRASEQTP